MIAVEIDGSRVRSDVVVVVVLDVDMCDGVVYVLVLQEDTR